MNIICCSRDLRVNERKTMIFDNPGRPIQKIKEKIFLIELGSFAQIPYLNTEIYTT